MNRFFDFYNFYIWGAGVEGKELQAILSLYGWFAGFIDNDVKKQKTGWNGEKVYSFEEYLQGSDHETIVIAAKKDNIKVISDQLSNKGFKAGEDFYTSELFLRDVFPILVFDKIGEIVIPLIQISLTERCTLKCRKCAHACFNVPSDAHDMSIEDVKNSADSFFSRADKAGEFVLIGGEPFLYKELSDAISYIGSRYRNRMGIFTITTNGTIIPKDEILDLCRNHKVLVRISNYSRAVPRLKNKYKKLCEKLDWFHVEYVLGDEEHDWIDYGFGEFDRGKNSDLRGVFMNCRTTCREIRKNRLYYCVMARSVSDNLGFQVGQDDYLDLDMLESKEQLLEFQMGKLKKGYLDMCRYCRGKDAENHVIPAAEQVKK